MFLSEATLVGFLKCATFDGCKLMSSLEAEGGGCLGPNPGPPYLPVFRFCVHCFLLIS